MAAINKALAEEMQFFGYTENGEEFRERNQELLRALGESCENIVFNDAALPKQIIEHDEVEWWYNMTS